MTTAWDRRTDTPLVCGGHQTLETVLFQLRSLYSCGGESHGLTNYKGGVGKRGQLPPDAAGESAKQPSQNILRLMNTKACM